MCSTSLDFQLAHAYEFLLCALRPELIDVFLCGPEYIARRSRNRIAHMCRMLHKLIRLVRQVRSLLRVKGIARQEV